MIVLYPRVNKMQSFILRIPTVLTSSTSECLMASRPSQTSPVPIVSTSTAGRYLHMEQTKQNITRSVTEITGQSKIKQKLYYKNKKAYLGGLKKKGDACVISPGDLLRELTSFRRQEHQIPKCHNKAIGFPIWG